MSRCRLEKSTPAANLLESTELYPVLTEELMIVNGINCSVYPHLNPHIQHILTKVARVITYFFPKERNKYYNMTPVDSNSTQLLQGMYKWVYFWKYGRSYR